ncbi:hypothetical protein ACIA98_25185 [Streptomyces sp. NPDC051366]|uniref:hypothetical protein n=1 Tax=Streptomyces sp. NPDC051366 TaxID=3365652 RepID=UPI00378912ED
MALPYESPAGPVLPAGLFYSSGALALAAIFARERAGRWPTETETGRAFAYLPLADESGPVARRMRQVLDGRADRGRCVYDLSDDDEELLRKLLDLDTTRRPCDTPSAPALPAAGRVGRPAAGRLPPRLATWMLTVGPLVLAAASAAVTVPSRRSARRVGFSCDLSEVGGLGEIADPGLRSSLDRPL